MRVALTHRVPKHRNLVRMVPIVVDDRLNHPPGRPKLSRMVRHVHFQIACWEVLPTAQPVSVALAQVLHRRVPVGFEFVHVFGDVSPSPLAIPKVNAAVHPFAPGNVQRNAVDGRIGMQIVGAVLRQNGPRLSLTDAIKRIQQLVECKRSLSFQ